MSLDTILQIGKVLRNSENSLKYFKYVEPCPKDKDGNWPICITLPVRDNLFFDWENMYITPEKQRNDLFYLCYSTSDNDSSPKKYIFGDISYTRKCEIDKTGQIKKINDFGNFTFEKGKENAFVNGQKTYQEIIDKFLRELIKEDVLNVVGEEKIKPVLDFILRSYEDEKPIDIPRKFNLYKEIIDISIEQLKQAEGKCELIKFRKAFEENINKINNLLLFAPVFETYMNDKNIIDRSLSNLKALQEYYLGVIKSTNQKIVEKMLDQDDSIDSFCAKTKNRLLQFADFTVFVHFEYTKDNEKKAWYQFDSVFNLIKDKLNSEVTQLTEKGLIPSKSIYRTLCSGNEKNDIQFPAFKLSNSFKSFAFKDKEQFEDFLYTGRILNKSFRRLKYTDIDMMIYPVAFKGEKISSKDYDDFFFDKKDESRLENDPIFSFFNNDAVERFNRFDFVFADSSGKTITDLIEVSGVERSALRAEQCRIEAIAKKMNHERNIELKPVKLFNDFQIEDSFCNILGNTCINSNGRVVFKANAKYKSHLLRVLPLIYTSNYYNDDLLFISFIQVSEYIIRNVENKYIGYNYRGLKYHLRFLLKIQNNKNDRFMEIMSSASYQIGFSLGEMAKNLSLKINSFEKNYVGTLTRRIGTLSDFIKLKNEIEQKLIMHDKAKYTYQISYDLTQKIKGFKSRYDKEECAFGFMESYFKPLSEPFSKINTTKNQ